MNKNSFEKIEVRKIEDERLLQAITTMDTKKEKANFWGSETYQLILAEIQENGWLRRHPVYTNYVVDVISGTVWRIGKTSVFKSTQHIQHGRVIVNVGSKKQYLSHIVMEAFLGQKLLKPVVHHYGYMFVADSIYNLRNTTQKENANEPHKKRKKYEHGAYEILMGGEVVYTAKTQKAAAEFIDCEPSAIYLCLRGNLKRVKGYEIRRAA
jgi:glucose uptake protein GlcU